MKISTRASSSFLIVVFYTSGDWQRCKPLELCGAQQIRVPKGTEGQIASGQSCAVPCILPGFIYTDQKHHVSDAALVGLVKRPARFPSRIYTITFGRYHFLVLRMLAIFSTGNTTAEERSNKADECTKSAEVDHNVQ